jgi:hypothetical protein
LGLQQELPVHGLQLQIVHAKHGARRLGRQFTSTVFEQVRAWKFTRDSLNDPCGNCLNADSIRIYRELFESCRMYF